MIDFPGLVPLIARFGSKRYPDASCIQSELSVLCFVLCSISIGWIPVVLYRYPDTVPAAGTLICCMHLPLPVIIYHFIRLKPGFV